MTGFKMKVSELIPNKKNPRIIKDHKYRTLYKSVRDFPEMLVARPIVIDENNIVLGGNMRLKVAKDLGLKEITVIKLTDLSESQKNEFIIKDNLNYGEWDFELIKDQWDLNEVVEWGMDLNLDLEYFSDDQNDDNSDGSDNDNKDNKNAPDNDYTQFELVLLHSNKLLIMKAISDVKAEFKYDKIEDALVHIIKHFNKNKNTGL